MKRHDAKDGERKGPQFVTALARGLSVLGCFKKNERFLGNQQIAMRTGLPKPSVSRITYTLTQLGHLKYSENHCKYSLGSAVLALSNAFLVSMSIRQIARPYMQELANHTQGFVSLGARDHLDIVYIENCFNSSSSFTMRLGAGMRIPIATTATGRAYLCGLPAREREHLLELIKSEYAADWPGIKADIEQSESEYRDMGFCLSVGHWQKDVNAVAIPLAPDDGSEVLVFNCGGPAFHFRRQMLKDDIGPKLANVVSRIENEMCMHL
jgi:DNA-binding IclR family transcriptional regulator